MPGELASTIDEESQLDRLIQDLERAGTDGTTERIVRGRRPGRKTPRTLTGGHSDRVACVAVRLAEELGCDIEVRKTVYLASLCTTSANRHRRQAVAQDRTALGG